MKPIKGIMMTDYKKVSNSISIITGDIANATAIEDPFQRLMAMANQVRKVQEEDIKITGMLDGSDLLTPTQLVEIIRKRYPYITCKRYSVNIFLKQAGLQTSREIGRISNIKEAQQTRFIYEPEDTAINARLCSVQYGGCDTDGRPTSSIVKWREEVVDVLAKRFGW